MDPSAVEVAAMTAIKHILDFVNIPGDPLIPTTSRGAFLAHMGADQDEHPRVLGSISEDDYKADVSNLMPNGVAMAPVLRTKVGLAGRIARICSRNQLSQDAEVEADIAAAAAAAAATAAQLATAQAAAATAAQLAAVAKPLGRTVKLSLTTQQGNDEEAPYPPRGHDDARVQELLRHLPSAAPTRGGDHSCSSLGNSILPCEWSPPVGGLRPLGSERRADFSEVKVPWPPDPARWNFPEHRIQGTAKF